jgi:hypothetical protein
MRMKMANDPMGNNVWEGVLGVVNINFGGVELGKTTADTELVPEETLKDIIFQQNGTGFADKVRTGMAMMVNCTFGEIKTSLLEKMIKGWEKSGDGDSLKMGRSLYQSMKDHESRRLLITRVDSDGASSTNPKYRIVFYKAAPGITGNIQWGADTQRNLAVTFYIFWDEDENSFGYSGYASSLGLSN